MFNIIVNVVGFIFLVGLITLIVILNNISEYFKRGR
nr:MAG TPA: hypothetical protein [Caudoviricetes sp.]